MDAFEAEVLAAVLRAALSTALVAWVESGGTTDLPTLADEAFAVLRQHLAPAPAPDSKGA